MTRPAVRDGTNNAQFRRRTPVDLAGRLAAFPVTLTFPATGTARSHSVTARHGANDIRFSLGTADPGTVHSRQAIARSHVEGLWSALRNGPTALTLKMTVALAGEVYRLFIDTHSDDPASPAVWSAMKGYNRAAREGRVGGPRLTVAGVGDQALTAQTLFGASEGAGLTAGINTFPAQATDQYLDGRFGELADYVLGLHGLVVDDASRARLLVQIEASTTNAAKALKANAAGDYTVDPMALSYPPTTTLKARTTGTGANWDALFQAWARRHAAADKQPATRKQARVVLDRFAAHVKGKSPTAVTKADVQAYCDTRLAAGLALRTVRYQDLAFIRAIYRAAAGAGVLADEVDPARTVSLPAVSGTSRRNGARRGYSNEDAAIILAAAQAETNPLYRWVPMMLAYSGARVSEVVCLRGCDVKIIDGIACFSVTPDAGRHVKTRHSIRDVPIHTSVIAAGFLDYAKTKSGNDRLFLTAARRRKSTAPPLRTRNTPKAQLRNTAPPAAADPDKPGKVATEKLRRWLRAIDGLVVGKAVGLDPNHAWRHRIKSIAMDAEIDSRIIDAICGHAPASAGAGYGVVSVKAKAAALAKIA